jgi:phenylpropionate dioxygenase-like ring-hydroxylating dioxygenase large terminal subunit
VAVDQDPGRRHPLWVRAAVNDDAFAHEQAALATMWTFVGMLDDIPGVGDWFRTTVGGRSIFVQRLEDGLRSFENRCAHRFYPLRTTDKGNGPILCGFHHWRYNADGIAIGIPNCTEMFGKTPREMNARIARLDLDTCGHLIFVRFPSSEESQTLRDYLAEGWDILAATCVPRRRPSRFRQSVAAYWKFSHHISLDDYHIVAVHPKSFGRHGYLKKEAVQYRRFGRHSAYLDTHDPDAFDRIRAACIDGSYRPEQHSTYSIFNLFPNLFVSQFRVPDVFGTQHRYALVTRYRGLARDRTIIEAWLFEMPFPLHETTLTRWNRWAVDLLVPPIAVHIIKTILSEDNRACERQQMLAAEVTGEQRLSAHEQRIGWFEEAYAEAVGRTASGTRC